jgi:hypothetical protein
MVCAYSSSFFQNSSRMIEVGAVVRLSTAIDNWAVGAVLVYREVLATELRPNLAGVCNTPGVLTNNTAQATSATRSFADRRWGLFRSTLTTALLGSARLLSPVGGDRATERGQPASLVAGMRVGTHRLRRERATCSHPPPVLHNHCGLEMERAHPRHRPIRRLECNWQADAQSRFLS